jgi:hypothetical protein
MGTASVDQGGLDDHRGTRTGRSVKPIRAHGSTALAANGEFGHAADNLVVWAGVGRSLSSDLEGPRSPERVATLRAGIRGRTLPANAYQQVGASEKQ